MKLQSEGISARLLVWLSLMATATGCATEDVDEGLTKSAGADIEVRSAKLDVNGNIRVLLMGDSQLQWSPAGYDVGQALSAFANNAHGGSNKMVVTAAIRHGAQCNQHLATSIPANTYDFVVFQPSLSDAAGIPTDCYNTILQRVDDANAQLGIMSAHTSQGCFPETTGCTAVRQGDIALHNAIRDYAAARTAARPAKPPVIHIPGSAFLRNRFGSNPDYNDLNPWYTQGDGHSSSRAVYAYVMAIYHAITGRTTIGGLTSLPGLSAVSGGGVATTAEAEQMQRFTSELFGKGTYYGKQLGLAVNQDGRVEAFYTTASDIPHHTWQTQLSTTAPWLGERLSGRNGNRFAQNPTVQRIVAAKDSLGRLYAFYIGPDNVLYRMRQDAASGVVLPWTTPTYLNGAGNRAKELSVIANSNGALEVFYIGTDDTIYHTWQTGPDSFSGEHVLGGVVKKAKQLALARHADGHLEVFYAGLNDSLYHSYRQANYTWSNQANFINSAYQAKRIAVGHNQDGRVEVFYIGTNDRLYHIWQLSTTGPWSSEAYLGTSSNRAKRLAVASNSDGRLEVAYIGIDDKIYHNWQIANGWSGQALLGTSVDSGREIGAVRDGLGFINVIYVGTDGRLLRNTQTASGWSGENPM